MYRSCLTIIKSCYFDCTINKPFTCSRCVICVSCSVHVISTYYVRKGSWAFYLNYPANQRGWGILSVELTDTVLFVCFWRLVGKTATQSSWWKLVAVLPSCTPPTESWHAISSTRLKVTFTVCSLTKILTQFVLVVLIVICCCCCCCCWWWWWWWWWCHYRFRSWSQLPLSKWFGLLNTLTQTEIQMRTRIHTYRHTEDYRVVVVCCVSPLFLCAL